MIAISCVPSKTVAETMLQQSSRGRRLPVSLEGSGVENEGRIPLYQQAPEKFGEK